MRRSASCLRSSSSLRSSPLAALLITALALWGCGGGGGGGETGGNGGAGGAAKGGTSGGGSTGKGGAAGTTTTGLGGAAGGTATGKGGAAGSATTGTGGAAGSTTTGTGGAAGTTTTGTGGAAGTTGTGGAAGSSVGGVGGSSVGGVGGSATTCTDGTSCTTSSVATGVCASGTCGGCTSTTACTTAYGTGYVCLTASGNCVLGNCATNGDCNGKICGSNHTCGGCATATDCTTAYGTGYVCQTSSGKCVQGNCNANGDCGTGQICGAGNTCTSCGTSDSACSTAYGNGFICVSGNCVTGACHSGAQCATGQICNSSHACAACTDDSGCQASYTDGRICNTTTGLCIIGNCHDNTQCSNQACVNNTCVNCTNSNQCSTGQVCLPSGACVTGDCLTAADCNDTSKVCINNSCGACTATSDCTAAYGTAHVCDTNHQCASGNCVTTTDCTATGQICGSQTPLTCGTCGSGAAGDMVCQTAYGSGYICSSGICITGSCHDSSTCGTGQVCDLTTHTCGGCGGGTAGDTTCKGDGRYGSTFICQGNICIAGDCHTAANCNDTTKVCNSFTCGACATNTDCTNAYGTNHVCDSNHQCQSGTCNTAADCGTTGQVCVSHACVACTAGSTGDGQCVNQYGPMNICLSGQCVAGNCHDTDAECSTGQICGIPAAHTCGGCGSGTAGDTNCKNDTVTFGGNYICQGNICQAGNCHATDTECPAGQLCSSLTCANCASGSAGDTQCQTDSHYGSGDICFQGLCGAGNCHATSADCTGANAGLICGASATDTCGSCTSDSQCKNDPFYGANDICNTTTGKCVSATCSPNSASCSANGTDYCCTGSCVTGNCCTDTDCGSSGTACVNHTCSACNAVSGNKWYVDPINGNDNTATGSDMSGTSVAPGCAFKTIKKLLNVMPSTPFAGTQIIIVGPDASGLAAGETYPITIPTNTTLTSSSGAVTITVPSGGTLFQLNNNASAISGGAGAALVLDGAGHTGNFAILNSPGTSTFTSSVSNLTIQNTNNDAIRVSAGTLTVGAGVTLTGSNQDGIRILGGAANINNLSGAETLFSSNTRFGIEVGTLGSVSISGTPGSIPSNSGTVVASGNTAAGIQINQTPGGAGLVTNSINGLVSWGNADDGMRLFGGSLVKVRNSVFLGNGVQNGVSTARYGVIVSGANVASGDDVSKIDLGKAGDPGKNWLQTPLSAVGNNTGGGLCVALSNCTGACLGGMGSITETVSAEGNEMVSTGGAQVDCSASTSAITRGTCGNGRSAGVNTATNVVPGADVAGCM
ncbi:MAG TPA: hypothetical protein VGP64_05415 [Polyangia bacterium]|jgi:hypothetical protein